MSKRSGTVHWAISSLIVGMLSFAGVFGDQGLLMGTVFVVVGFVLLAIGA